MSQWFLQFSIRHGGDVRPALGAIHREAATQGAHVVVGLGDRLARQLLPGEVPDQIRSFCTITGTGRLRVPSTHHDQNHDVALAARRLLGEVGHLADDTPGWRYREGRDLTGFAVGAQNQSVTEATELAVIEEGPGAGGSVALVQRWQHDLDDFHALHTTTQERIVGRTKTEDRLLDPLPPTRTSPGSGSKAPTRMSPSCTARLFPTRTPGSRAWSTS